MFLFIVGDRIRLCLVIYRALVSSMFLLLFFEPFSIAFETLQVLLLKHLLATFVMVGYSQMSVHRLTRLFVFPICSVGYFSSWISVAWCMAPSFSREQCKLPKVQIFWYISSRYLKFHLHYLRSRHFPPTHPPSM